MLDILKHDKIRGTVCISVPQFKFWGLKASRLPWSTPMTVSDLWSNFYNYYNYNKTTGNGLRIVSENLQYRFLQLAALLAMQSAVIATKNPSVCPSITCWYLIQTNENKITRSSLWGSKNTLVFWYQQWLGRYVPFNLKFALKVTNPLWKAPTSTNICL